MLPLDSVTLAPVPTAFLPPMDTPYNPLVSKTRGGVALNDGSQGREIQTWTAVLTGGSVAVTDQAGVLRFTLSTPGALTVGLAFDSNMAPVIAYQTATGSRLYYFNSLTAAYDTFVLPTADSCRASIDDTRLSYVPFSDVIWSYTRAGNLYYRQQRDRYLTERLVGPAVGTLTKAYKNLGNRFQWEVDPNIPLPTLSP